jgi:hypothetical protein
VASAAHRPHHARHRRLVGNVGLLLAGTFAVAFEPAFRVFHEIFFPPGTWLFEPGSNLITLFPQGFWFDAALAAGATIIVGGTARQPRRPEPLAGRPPRPHALI